VLFFAHLDVVRACFEKTAPLPGASRADVKGWRDQAGHGQSVKSASST
jgi:hypothetical protein